MVRGSAGDTGTPARMDFGLSRSTYSYGRGGRICKSTRNSSEQAQRALTERGRRGKKRRPGLKGAIQNLQSKKGLGGKGKKTRVQLGEIVVSLPGGVGKRGETKGKRPTQVQGRLGKGGRSSPDRMAFRDPGRRETKFLIKHRDIGCGEAVKARDEGGGDRVIDHGGELDTRRIRIGPRGRVRKKRKLITLGGSKKI